jgi:predicted pyridoxine 5'-phosphate oxidase superfamily flavin-nucleotide-binding protein
MPKQFSKNSRALQDRFDTRRLADRVAERIIKDTISESDREFIEARDLFFLATVDEAGVANCSYKGGDPGFVQVVDEQTVAFPNYDGNGMYMSMGNVLETGSVGLLFIDFENQRRMRLNGVATVDWDDPLMADYSEAQFIVRVSVQEAFPNCPRYIHKMQLVERSKFVPHADCETPIPDWKLNHERDVLPESDQAKIAKAAQ